MNVIEKIKKWQLVNTLKRQIVRYLKNDNNSEPLYLFCYYGDEENSSELNSLQDFADGLFHKLGLLTKKSDIKVCIYALLTVKNCRKLISVFPIKKVLLPPKPAIAFSDFMIIRIISLKPQSFLKSMVPH